METRAVRGMHDLFGEEIAKWHYVENKIRKCHEDFGYSEIRTPVLEYVDVYKHGVGDDTDIVEKQMFLIDKGEKESFALRPEGTAGFIRAVLEHQLNVNNHPARYYYYLPMFRYERPQKGRQRQFFQFGGEFICDPSPEADVEIVCLLDTSLKAVGLKDTDYEVRVNSVGCSDCRPAYKSKLTAWLQTESKELCEDCKRRIDRAPLRVFDCKNPACVAALAKAPRLINHLDEKCKTHHETFKRRLTQSGTPFIEDTNIVRGLDYYCRTAFEFTSTLLGAQSALGGGGRYDGLAEKYGAKPFASVGYALGMERVLIALEEKKALPNLETRLPLFLVALGDKAYEMLFATSMSWRKKGLWNEMSYDPGKNMKSQLKMANRQKSRFTLILGEDEIQKGIVVLKAMDTGDQETLQWSNLEHEIRERISRAT